MHPNPSKNSTSSGRKRKGDSRKPGNKPKTNLSRELLSREPVTVGQARIRKSAEVMPVTRVSAEPLHPAGAGVAPKKSDPLLEKACREFVRQTNKADLASIKREWLEASVHVPQNSSAMCGATHPEKNAPWSNPCLDATRVKLTFNSPLGQDYIHANWVTTTHCQLGVRLILAQAPQNNTIDDFWRMVWQEKVHSVVMLCQKYENQKRVCAQYFPAFVEDTICYGHVTVTNQADMTPRNDNSFEKYRLSVVQAAGQAHPVYIYLFRQWPEADVPANSTVPMLRIVRTVEAEGGTAVIHGSAGVGRPGIFAALTIALKMLKEGRVCPLLNIVKEVREQRLGAVASEIQYVYLYAAICEYMRRKEIEQKHASHFFAKFLAYRKQYVEAGNRPVPVYDPGVTQQRLTSRPPNQQPPSPIGVQPREAPGSPLIAPSSPVVGPVTMPLTTLDAICSRPATSPCAGPSDRAVAIAPMPTISTQPNNMTGPGTTNQHSNSSDAGRLCKRALLHIAF